MIDKAGHIVTNYHVIQGAKKVQVSFSGQDEITATVVGKDPSTDVAILKIDAHARALTPLELGNSDAVIVGDPVDAIGNPFGFTRTLTTGVVSAVQRQIEAPNSLPIDHAIQTDAAINHGNSGGPLIDAHGRVIGVTSQISTGTTGGQGNVGIGFAIPINTVRNVAAQIISSGKAQHAFLGLDAAPVTPQLAKLFHLPSSSGLLIQDVQAGSGADKAGLRAGKTAVVVQGESYQVGRRPDRRDRRPPGDHLPAAPRRHLAAQARRQAEARDLPQRLEKDGHGQARPARLTPGSAQRRSPSALPRYLVPDGARADRPRAHGRRG